MFGSIALYFFSDSSDSDSEDVYYPKVPRYVSKAKLQQLQQYHGTNSNDDSRLQRRILRDATNVFDLPEEQFFRSFRVNKVVFSKILEEITPSMQTTYRCTHIPAPIKLARFLAFIATGIGTVDKEHASVMSKSQVSKTICEILDIFEKHLYGKWVILDENEAAENSTKQHFQNISGIAGIVGCVDNTHVRIKKPDKGVRDLYNNGQDFSSLNVMMICDHNMVIKYVDASQPGSYHDAYVWDQSSANEFFRTNYINGKTNTWLVGDSAYKLLPYMMIPYRDPKEEHQKFFNEQILKASDIIKQCSSILKKRFSCLITPKGLYYSPDKAVKTVISCCILHNICIAYKNKWLPANNTAEDINNDDDENKIEIFNEDCIESSSIREELALQSFLISQTHKNPQDSNKDSKHKALHQSALRHSSNVLNIPDDKFMKTFGVSKEVFSLLLEEITPKLKVTYRITHTPAAIRLATFLEFIAKGPELSSIKHEYTTTMCKSQISKIVCEMLDIFEEHLYGKWIKLEQTPEDENIAKEQFYNASGLPGIVGCVDNIHIQIKTPGKDVKKLYLNRTNFYSLNVMLICDHNMVIKYVNAYQPGSYHDAYVWEQSSAENYFRQKTNTWLIGDSAYKLQPYMMIPYENPNQPHEYKFNQQHFQARKIITKCFDIIKHRFKCLFSSAGLQYTPEKASKIVIACCILHNICISCKNFWPSNDITYDDVDNECEQNIIEAHNIEGAKSLRHKIAMNL